MRAFLLLLLIPGALGADPRFRADDGNLWHLSDNPAMPADGFAFGFSAPPDQDWESGAKELRLTSPLLSFDYQWQGSDSNLRLVSALGPFDGFSLGYASQRLTHGGEQNLVHDFGLLYRPFNFLSVAAGLDDAFGLNRTPGAGIALRPLALFSPRADWLTLTADVSGTSWGWESLGVRLSWEGSDLRGWYDPQAKTLAMEVTLGLGASETSLSARRLGQAFRWTSRTPELRFGSQILRIRAPGALSSAPRLASLFTAGGGDLPGLIALLDRAVSEPAIKAVAFEGAPTVEGLASAEELRQALDRLKKAGKKIYLHADSLEGLGYQSWMARADRLSIPPTGSVWLTAGSSRRLYLKDFFDKIGVKFVNFAPWETKSANNGLTFSSMPEGERAMLKRFLSDRDALALETLTQGRGERLKRKAADLVAQGPWLVAKEARELGLVDALESTTDFEDFINGDLPGASFIDRWDTPAQTTWGPALNRSTVALVYLTGDIVLGPGQAARSIGTRATETLRALRTDPTIRAIMLRVDSPGGAVTPSDALAEEVKKSVAAGKPVVVVMGDLAASGGYYLSAPASRIFARPGTLTGSIGVTAALFTAEKALDLLGIHADGVDLAPSSRFGDWTRSLGDADSKKWAAMIEATYDRFLDVVAEGRKLDKAKVELLARGQIYTGREALTLGLVDELGGQLEAQAWLRHELGTEVEFKEYTPGETNPWGDLLVPLASGVARASGSPVFQWADALDPVLTPWAEAVTALAARGGGPLVWVDVP